MDATKHSNTFHDLPIAYDLVSHHALGGGSYVFKAGYPSYLMTLLPPGSKRTEINVVLQPNSSPHVGTLCSLGLAFVVARRLQDLGVEILVVCDLWDQAKGEELVIKGVKYQRSLRETGRLQQYLPDYIHVLEQLGKEFAVKYHLRFEEEFLRQPGISGVLERIIKNRAELGRCLMPSTGTIALRAPCPTCGLVDKYGVNNIYSEECTSISFQCPHHGAFVLTTETDAHHMQFNCQLFNLVMGLYYEQVDYGWIEICGSDYAGFWQEQLMCRFLSKPAVIVYTPLISDWAGSKVSKSLYLRKHAYDYLRDAGQEYLLSYNVFRRTGIDIGLLWREIERWVDEPYRLFRGYSLHYLHLLFQGYQVHLGIIHKSKCQDGEQSMVAEGMRQSS